MAPEKSRPPEVNPLICHGVLAPRARWRERVVAYGRVAAEPAASTVPLAPGPGGTGVKPGARLDLGRPGVCPLWGPAAPDRHAARSRRHPKDPRAPGPRPLGAESRPRHARAQRRRALIASGRGARAADLPSLAASRRSSPSGLLCRVRPSGRLTPALRPGYDAAQPARRSQLLRNAPCALCLRLREQRGDDREQPARQGQGPNALDKAFRTAGRGAGARLGARSERNQTVKNSRDTQRGSLTLAPISGFPRCAYGSSVAAACGSGGGRQRDGGHAAEERRQWAPLSVAMR